MSSSLDAWVALLDSIATSMAQDGAAGAERMGQLAYRYRVLAQVVRDSGAVPPLVSFTDPGRPLAWSTPAGELVRLSWDDVRGAWLLRHGTQEPVPYQLATLAVRAAMRLLGGSEGGTG